MLTVSITYSDMGLRMSKNFIYTIYLIIMTILSGKYFYLTFIDEEIKAQAG